MAAAAFCVIARGVQKAHSTGGISHPILKGVDLSIPTGSLAVLIGPSGCGKTTLLNLIGALDVPDRGELVVGGVSLHTSTRRELSYYRRHTIGFIFQFYNLMPTLTARENLEIVLEPLGLPRATRKERARYFLSLVGLERHAEKFPSQLSGGEQQRVAIARALVKTPRLVLADEPTGNLDQANGHQVIELVQRFNLELGTSFLIATHDPTIARTASHVVQMADGVVRSHDEEPDLRR